MLSKRIRKVSANHVLAEAHFRCAQNPWSSENPEGFINLGTAEHASLSPLMNELLQNAPVAIEEDLHYHCLYGKFSARQEVAKWLSVRAERQLKADHVVLASGATAIIEALGFALCDPGDIILIPAPCYCGFQYDLESRARVKLEYIPCWSKDNFSLLPENIEVVFNRVRHNGGRVKALLLHSPTNPSGRLYSGSELEHISDYCAQVGIELIVDEVCSDTSFDLPRFYSALTFGCTHVHVIHSLGKGYGIAGLASGIFYSDNSELVQAIASQAYFARMPNHLQTQMVWLLNHRNIHGILKQSCAELSGIATNLVHQLEDLGVAVNPPQAGVFIWCYLGRVLDIQNFEDELAVFERLIREARINISPGQYFNAFEPGWFRLCFSLPEGQLSTAVQRLKAFIQSHKDG